MSATTAFNMNGREMAHNSEVISRDCSYFQCYKSIVIITSNYFHTSETILKNTNILKSRDALKEFMRVFAHLATVHLDFEII